MTTFVPVNQKIGEYDNKQALQFLQRGTGLGVLAGVQHGARGKARYGARQGVGGGRVVWNDWLAPFTDPQYLLPDMSYNCQAKKRFGNS